MIVFELFGAINIRYIDVTEFFVLIWGFFGCQKAIGLTTIVVDGQIVSSIKKFSG